MFTIGFNVEAQCLDEIMKENVVNALRWNAFWLEQSASTGGVPQEALIQQLTASRDAKQAEAQSGYQAAMGDAITKEAMPQLYVEPTQALKKANLRLISENDRRGSATEVYSPLLHALVKPLAKSGGSPMPLTEVVKILIDKLNRNRADLLNSKPPIPAR